MKTIVVSAVNLNKGGTLQILRDCLYNLNLRKDRNSFRVIALVYDKSLPDIKGIHYLETKWPKKRWVNRLWYEYISMRCISKRLGSVFLWFSLHDTSPNVSACRRAVYCHNSFPFYTWKKMDWVFAPKIAMFATFTALIYNLNLKKNDYVVVQQQWFRRAFIKRFHLSNQKIIVAPPAVRHPTPPKKSQRALNSVYRFIFPATADSHKNFECLCDATAKLLSRVNLAFEVILTIDGTETAYSRWLKNRWGRLRPVLRFEGYQTRANVERLYEESDCLIFPSMIETWGLPISEYARQGKPMLLADLPYARETAQGTLATAFFNPNDSDQLANYMANLINGDLSMLREQTVGPTIQPYAPNWDSLFDILTQ